MSSYDWYLFVRGIEELLDRLMPALVITILGVLGLLAYRLYLKRRYGPDTRELERRVVALERKLADDVKRLDDPPEE